MSSYNNLITSREVVELSFVEEKNFLDTKIKGSLIFAAQEKYILPILGEGLYSELQVQIRDSSLTTLMTLLLNDFVKPTLAYYVKYLAAPSLSRPIKNTGIQQFTGQGHQASKYQDVQSIQKTSLRIGDALAMAMTRYIEKNKADFKLYVSENNVKNRVGIGGGIIRRKGRRKKTVVYSNSTSVLPNYYVFAQSLSGDTWTFGYKGKIKNEGVQVTRVLDSMGNDIYDYADSVIVDPDSEAVLVSFSELAWLNPNDKSGMVEIYTAEAASKANIVRAIINIDVENSIATLEIIEGTAATPSYKWYINETLNTSSNSNTLNIQDLSGKGYLRCEVWQNGNKLVSVFERYDIEVIIADDENYIPISEDGVMIV